MSAHLRLSRLPLGEPVSMGFSDAEATGTAQPGRDRQSSKVPCPRARVLGELQTKRVPGRDGNFPDTVGSQVRVLATCLSMPLIKTSRRVTDGLEAEADLLHRMLA